MGGGSGRRGRGPASRLPAHRAVLALGLLAAGPPLVLHDGWRGAIPAVAAAGYAVYLIAGKRWPRLGRAKRPATRPTSTNGSAAATATGMLNSPAGPAPRAEQHRDPDPLR